MNTQLSIFDNPLAPGNTLEIRTTPPNPNASKVRKDNPPKRPTIIMKNGKLADKLETMADKMQPAIDNKLSHDRLTNTPRRMAQAMHARVEGERLARTQQAMRALAAMHRAGNCPPLLSKLRSKKAIYDEMGAELTSVPNGYHAYMTDSGKPRENASPVSLALWGLLTDKSEADKQADALAQAIRDLQFSKIEGYFPTPAAVVELMLDYAQVSPTDCVLEPSAGSGAILDHIPEDCMTVAMEINPDLCRILQMKGFDARPVDFLDFDPSTSEMRYDRVLMNPPFERLQDIDHVRHAYRWLKDGGRLVSVMSPGPFFRSDKKCQSFRAWVEDHGGEVIDLPDGSFKESGTGVASKLLVIDK